MRSPNNPLTPTEASKFPVEVLRAGPAKRETKGREVTNNKAFWGKLKQLGGTLAGLVVVKTPGTKVDRPLLLHSTHTVHRTLSTFICTQSATRLRGFLDN